FCWPCARRPLKSGPNSAPDHWRSARLYRRWFAAFLRFLSVTRMEAQYMLALNGGTPIRRNENWPKWPVHTPETLKALDGVLHSQRWSISGVYSGAPARERVFSEKWAAWNGAKHAVGTSNGSSALLIALESLDIGPGDEVIVPGLCWVAPATAALN